MKFSVYDNVKSQKGIWCTHEQWLKYSASKRVKQICDSISQLSPDDHDAIGELKKGLPVVTWQAYFEGRRLNSEAQLSGLCMLDVDKVDDPYKLWRSIVARREELGIMLAHKTPSGHGLRLVFRCRPEFTTLDECQQWMAHEIGVEHDAACKDPARASYMVPENYVYYYDGKLFSMEPEVVYEVKSENGKVKSEVEEVKDTEPATVEPADLQTTYSGIPLTEIANKWLLLNGGIPEKGSRNTRLHALAFEMRYITDFNEETLFAVIPHCELDEKQVRSLIHSACIAPRSVGLPKKLKQVLELMSPDGSTFYDEAEEELSLNSTLSTLNSQLPPLPPLIQQVVKTAPADFKPAAILCQLPILGTLASRLRAKYLDGNTHSPSFQVSLEAPQASGKSFMMRLVQMELAPILARDEEAYLEEREYSEKAKTMGSKYTPEQRQEMLGPRPKGIIRCIPPTASITKMLMRMDNAHGLHLFSVSEEVDTVTKAFKKGFSNYSDLLRVAFDNGRYGQDYASDTSFSGVVNVYYNTLFSGTPKAMCRFYPDVEDGLVSRVCFVTLPDQMGKPMPIWSELSDKDRREVESQIARLDGISLQGDTVQREHRMELRFLNEAMQHWLDAQRQLVNQTQDRVRDTYYKRAAVVGFRAGMLAWFLYGEKPTRTYRKNTVLFATWVANYMLTQHLLRYPTDSTTSNINRWEAVYRSLGDEFSREELRNVLSANNSTTPVKKVIQQWRMLGCIETLETSTAANGKLQAVRFRKK